MLLEVLISHAIEFPLLFLHTLDENLATLFTSWYYKSMSKTFFNYEKIKSIYKCCIDSISQQMAL